MEFVTLIQVYLPIRIPTLRRTTVTVTLSASVGCVDALVPDTAPPTNGANAAIMVSLHDFVVDVVFDNFHGGPFRLEFRFTQFGLVNLGNPLRVKIVDPMLGDAGPVDLRDSAAKNIGVEIGIASQWVGFLGLFLEALC